MPFRGRPATAGAGTSEGKKGLPRRWPPSHAPDRGRESRGRPRRGPGHPRTLDCAADGVGSGALGPHSAAADLSSHFHSKGGMQGDVCMQF